MCPAPAPGELNILTLRAVRAVRIGWGMQYLTPGNLQVQSLFLYLPMAWLPVEEEVQVLEDWEGDEISCNSAGDGGQLASFLHWPALGKTEPVSGERERPEARPLDSQHPECFQGQIALLGKSSNVFVTSSLKHAPGPLRTFAEKRPAEG